jgi:phage I-like protein
MSELSKKGENIYQTKILPNLPVDKLKGKIVAIEVESEDYFVEDTVLKAVMLGRKRYPQQKFYCKRVGYRAVYSHKGYVPVKYKEK